MAKFLPPVLVRFDGYVQPDGSARVECHYDVTPADEEIAQATGSARLVLDVVAPASVVEEFTKSGEIQRTPKLDAWSEAIALPLAVAKAEEVAPAVAEDVKG